MGIRKAVLVLELLVTTGAMAQYLSLLPSSGRSQEFSETWGTYFYPSSCLMNN